MRTAAGVLAIVTLGCMLSGCTSHASEPVAPLLPTSSPTPSRSVLPPPISTPNVPPTRASAPPSVAAGASTGPTGFSDAYVSQCNGRPSAEQVIAAVRRARPNLPLGSAVSVKNAPVCAGLWQYTILNITGSEPLQVMTKGAPTALTVVTAGTDPCTPEVQATAPPALLNVAAC